MSEMEVTEGQLLSEQFDVGGPPAAVKARPLPVIEAELDMLKQDTRQKETALLCNYIEIGRRLTEAKAQLHHGQWGDWLKKKEFSQSTANNFMRLFREYGADQQSLFGGVVKSQTFANLTVSKALRLLDIQDEEERERFAAEHDVANMSVRELNEALKARDEAQEKAAAAEEEAHGLWQENEQLREQLTDQARTYNAKLISAGIETQQARQAQEKAVANAQRLQDALSEANNAVQAAEEEHNRLVRKLEELRIRPAGADTAAMEAIRKATIAEMTAKVDKADDARKQAVERCKATEKAFAAMQRELAELKAKGPEVRELTQEEKDALTASAVEQARAGDAERMQTLEKQLAKADPDTTTLMVLSQSWQETYTKIWETLNRIEVADSDKAQKLRGGIRKVLETALEQIRIGST